MTETKETNQEISTGHCGSCCDCFRGHSASDKLCKVALTLHNIISHTNYPPFTVAPQLSVGARDVTAPKLGTSTCEVKQTNNQNGLELALFLAALLE